MYNDEIIKFDVNLNFNIQKILNRLQCLVNYDNKLT